AASVDRGINRLTRNRAVVTRDDKLAARCHGTIRIAALNESSLLLLKQALGRRCGVGGCGVCAGVRVERAAQLANRGVAVISGRRVLFRGHSAVFGFGELDRTDSARLVGPTAGHGCGARGPPIRRAVTVVLL